MKMNLLSECVKALAPHQPALRPKSIWNGQLEERIGALRPEEFAPAGDKPAVLYAMCVKSGLHLWNESLDASHTLSQDIDNSTGSYWHGIMHRMEGDYGNSKYWFRLVGSHPLYAALGEAADTILSDPSLSSALAGRGNTDPGLGGAAGWDPHRFVDLVAEFHHMAADHPAVRALSAIQKREIALLLNYCSERSGGGVLVDLDA